MSTTISDGTTTLTPQYLDGYEVTRASENIVHNIIGTTDNAVTLRGSGLRTGTMKLTIGTADALAWQFDSLLKQAKVLTLADTDRPAIGMRFVVKGHTIALDDDTRSVWLATVDIEETTS